MRGRTLLPALVVSVLLSVPMASVRADHPCLVNNPLGMDTPSCHDLLPAKAVSAGYAHTCALLAHGDVQCWGGGPYYPGLPMESRAGLDATAVSAGYDHTCALVLPVSSTSPPVGVGRNVRCWGMWGQDYDGADAFAVSAGSWNTCVLVSSSLSSAVLQPRGKVLCWEWSGNWWTEAYPGGDAVAVAAGASQACAVRSNGNVQCWWLPSGVWGWEAYDGGDAVDVTVDGYWGDDRACVLRSNGNVRCWDSSSQTDPYTGGDAIAVSAGEGFACALLSDGNVTCWGDNYLGQAEGYNGGDAVALDAGADHACVLLRAGNVQCWGSNEAGQSGGYEWIPAP